MATTWPLFMTQKSISQKRAYSGILSNKLGAVLFKGIVLMILFLQSVLLNIYIIPLKGSLASML